MSKLRPLGNHVLIQRAQAKTTKGGLLIPESAQEKPKEGKVLAAGPGKTNDDGVVEKMTVKPGDTILFGGYSGTEVKLGEEDGLLILTEDDVLAIIE
jgi:chaperonin GroES